MKKSSGEKSNACTQDGDTYLQMILSVRMMRFVMPLFSFLLIWSATHTGVSGRARVTGVSPSRFMMSMSAPLDRNNLETKEMKRAPSLQSPSQIHFGEVHSVFRPLT